MKSVPPENVIRAWHDMPVVFECKYVSDNEVCVYIKSPFGLRFEIVKRALNSPTNNLIGYSRLELMQSAGEHIVLESPLKLADLDAGPMRVCVAGMAQGRCMLQFFAPFSVNIVRSKLREEKVSAITDSKLQGLQQKLDRLELRTKKPMTLVDIDDHLMQTDILVTDLAHEFERTMESQHQSAQEDNKLRTLRHLHGRSVALQTLLDALRINANYWLLDSHPHFVTAIREALPSQEFERVSRKAEANWRLHCDALGQM